MTSTPPDPRAQHGNAYQVFILVLTIYSLVIMVALLLPLSPQTIDLLRVYDNLICFIFLFDFTVNFVRAPSKRGFMLGERGWLDLLGSIPSVPSASGLGLLRLARLSRLTRIRRVLRGQNRKEFVRDFLVNRAHYAVLVTLLAGMLVLSVGSVIVLNAESTAPNANIKTGGDALWWSVVTLTTVGYGDFYPVTSVGRGAATFIMAMGIGIIGSLASIMASLLVNPTSADEQDGDAPRPDELERKLDVLNGELVDARKDIAALRELIESLGRTDPIAR
jgi:voltage-gated potassium channel